MQAFVSQNASFHTQKCKLAHRLTSCGDVSSCWVLFDVEAGRKRKELPELEMFLRSAGATAAGDWHPEIGMWSIWDSMRATSFPVSCESAEMAIRNSGYPSVAVPLLACFMKIERSTVLLSLPPRFNPAEMKVFLSVSSAARKAFPSSDDIFLVSRFGMKENVLQQQRWKALLSSGEMQFQLHLNIRDCLNQPVVQSKLAPMKDVWMFSRSVGCQQREGKFGLKNWCWVFTSVYFCVFGEVKFWLISTFVLPHIPRKCKRKRERMQPVCDPPVSCMIWRSSASFLNCSKQILWFRVTPRSADNATASTVLFEWLQYLLKHCRMESCWVSLMQSSSPGPERQQRHPKLGIMIHWSVISTMLVLQLLLVLTHNVCHKQLGCLCLHLPDWTHHMPHVCMSDSTHHVSDSLTYRLDPPYARCRVCMSD